MNKFLKLSLLIFIYTISLVNVSAADFFTTSNKTEVFENEYFDVNIFVNADGTTINSAEGSLSFPADILSVVSLTNVGSIFSIWVEQPTYSNAGGTISFNGGLPNPGFSGARGNVVKATFKTKKPGTAVISFGAGNIYSNDGSGTDVLKRKSGVSVTVKSAVVKPVAKTETKDPEIIQNINNKDTVLPPLPNVSSSDLPKNYEWFNVKNINLDWDVPSGVTAVQFSFGGKEDAIPTKIYSPAINFTKLVNVANGVSYFHIRFKNSAGWGEVLHKKIMVDTVPPGDITGSSGLNDKKLISLTVNSTDIHSDIDKYEIYLDNNKIAEVKGGSGKDVVIDLPLLKTGLNKINIIAYDHSGNTVNKTINLNSSEPEPAQINVSKIEVKIGEENSALIKSYPDTDIIVFIKDENENIKKINSKTYSNGVTNLPLSGFEIAGIKTIWVSLNNDCANICVLSEKIIINVLERKLVYTPKALSGFIQKQTTNSSIPWTIAIIFIILYLLTFRRNKNKDIIQELNKAEVDVYKIFKVLKSDAKKYKSMLKRNNIDIVEKDQAIIENLEKDLDEAETYFANRIEKIERELM
jgi:hypothetical protein